MKYLGIMTHEHGRVTMPDTFHALELRERYDVIEVDGDVLLLPAPFDPQRLTRIERLTKCSIAEHRQTLEGLAR